MKIAKAYLSALFVGVIAFAAGPVPVQAGELWQSLSAPAPTPDPVASGYVHANGIDIYFAIHGAGPPLILLHGGLGNTDYWGGQIAAFSGDYRVITIASRGHGRSTRDDRPYGYHLMATDVLAVMDALGIDKAPIVGWSDGGNIGLDIAINNPDRLTSLFAFGANFHPSGVMASVDTDATFGAYVELTAVDYAKLSATPDDFDAFVEQIGEMWATQPDFSEAQLNGISVPIAIVVGEHDEAIDPAHTNEMAAMIPGATLIVMPGLSHFGMWQDPDRFNREVLNYLDAN